MPKPDAATPQDPGVAVWFDPDAIREHFAETDHEASSRELPDAVLVAAARHVVVDSERLWSLFDELCLDILERATHLKAAT